ncbi:5-formyltetrahydrofolate cyclo-ligase [Coleofasciculus sp. FACHB-542]|uniref:5-formyltetrahydrofolate cyclo-ligase n=1 Tax=Coleofasciculus sp. FACHB-542 TaxID=2692787 RepID=UPI00321F792B
MNKVDHQLDKQQLRRSLLKTRQLMPVEEWREKSDRICTHLESSHLFTQSKTVLAYFSFRQEPDLSPLISARRRWGFPRCVGDRLIWHLWKPGDSLQKGAYGILEPHPDSPVLHSTEVDLILVPSVACDVRGYRLGYGGGYYDRLLNSSEWATQLTIGIVFDFAFSLELPIDSWDKSLQGVCTETGLRMMR